MVAYLADEDVPGPILRALAEYGLDVVSVSSGKAGSVDDVVLAHACESGRVLLTQDLEFAERVIRRQLPCAGVIIIRLRGSANWQAKAERVRSALEQLGELATHAVATIDWNGVRVRDLKEQT
jgi:predicted nuclease of predicted toxin-antitoxin system